MASLPGADNLRASIAKLETVSRPTHPIAAVATAFGMTKEQLYGVALSIHPELTAEVFNAAWEAYEVETLERMLS